MDITQLVLLMILKVTIVLGHLEDVLSKYDTLHHVSMEHRVVKRDTTSGAPISRQIEFDSLGKHFHLFLQKKKGVLAKDHQVVAVNSKNERRVVDVSSTELYGGYMLDEPSTSDVQAVWEDSEVMMATIRTKDEVYIVEPSWRHLPKSDNYSMIVYKASDVHMDEDLGEQYCGYIDVNKEYREAAGVHEDHDEKVHDRQKRQSSGFEYSFSRTSCQLKIVADYHFFEEMGQSSLLKTSSYLIGLMDRVDTIFRQTDFQGYTNMGFEIKETLIHEEPTEVPHHIENGERVPDYLHYNMEKEEWDTKDLLEVFSLYSSDDYCLSHLFTARSKFSDTGSLLGLSYIANPMLWQPGGICSRGGVLGLAYIGSPRTYSVGGICSPEYYKNRQTLYLNTGWSSSLNKYGRRLLTQEADLVTTHEFGHNWGSEHDPDNDDCSPSSFKGGKYIMYTYSVSGYDPNNKIFSPCSQRSIGEVLRAKSQSCFEEPKEAFCGNSRKEEGEECDPGYEHDMCCTSECKLKENFECSDANDECCMNCMLAPVGIPCNLELQSNQASCEGNSTCNGSSARCPKPEPKPDGTACFQHGECQDGVCIPYCERNGLVSCICDDVENACRWCCKSNQNSSCMPFQDPVSNEYNNLTSGMPCIQGFCDDNGECKKQVQDLVQRLWDIIENLTPSQFVEMMRDNIVGTVIILSLCIWVPVSCAVSYKDRKMREDERDTVDWLSADNDYLIRPEEHRRIKKARGVKARPRGQGVSPRMMPKFYPTESRA